MLPGDIIGPHPTDQCGQCLEPAVHGVVGECDSFGYEVEWYCEKHFAERKPFNRYTEGTCDCCGQVKQVRARHDPGEGGGRVYDFCDPCYNRKVAFELDD